jgi:hypothetical protein
MPTKLEQLVREEAYAYTRTKVATKPTAEDDELILGAMMHIAQIVETKMAEDIKAAVLTEVKQEKRKEANDKLVSDRNKKVFDKTAKKPNMGVWSQNPAQKAKAAREAEAAAGGTNADE